MGRQAARHDHTVLYVRAPRLFEDLAMAKLDGRYPRLMNRLMKVQLLILDDFATHTLNDQQRFHLFEIIEERYQRRSTLFTAQVPVNTWHDLIGDETVADAILDRVVHNAHRINLEGDSMRKAKSRIDATLNVNDERTEG
jgi:DNA replication protein DnaC